MSVTFDIISINTVPKTYSWDKGTPMVTYTDLVTSLDQCKKSSTNSSQCEYVGYAPFVSIALSSDSGALDSSAVITRTVNFGDYYNSEYNEITKPLTDLAIFNHSYVMPGLYSIKFTRTEYVTLSVYDPVSFGPCYQKYCIDWNWANLNSSYSSLPNVLDFTWSATKKLSAYAKTWRREPCMDAAFSANGSYEQKIAYLENKRSPLSWQWYNFLQNSPKNILNTVTPWISTGFQQADQLTWNQTAGPCLLNLNYRNTDIIWTWDTITAASTGRYKTNLTWDEVRCHDPGNVTWDFVKMFCAGDKLNYQLSAATVTIVKEAFVRVLEIPPQAFLQVIQPEDRLSPLTVTLTPRNIISGSFPIEKIVWDLGDGSPLLTQRRWAPTLEAPFVYSGLLSEDYEDPRNYDIVYTYRKELTSSSMFYPSLTAYASSTGTFDSAAAVVGPIKYTEPTINFDLLQTELTDTGKIILGQVDGNVALWKANK